MSLLSKDGETVVQQQTYKPYPIREQVNKSIPISLTEQFAALSTSQPADSKYHLLLKTLIATNPYIYAPDLVRALIRPVQDNASKSALFHYGLAKLAQTKSNSKGQQLSHLEKARKLSKELPLFVFEIVKRTLSEEPDKALDMIAALEKSSKPPSQVTLLKFAIYKLRGWFQFADETYKKALSGWMAQDNILGALSYFRSRNDVETIRQLEERFVKESGSYADDARLRLEQYRGQSENLEPMLKRAITSKAATLTSFLELAKFYLVRSKPDEAIKIATDYLKRYPDSTEMMRIVISALQATGDHEKLKTFITDHQEYLSSNLDFEVLRASLENRIVGLPSSSSKLAQILELDPIAIASSPLNEEWNRHGTVRLLDRHVDYLQSRRSCAEHDPFPYEAEHKRGR